MGNRQSSSSSSSGRSKAKPERSQSVKKSSSSRSKLEKSQSTKNVPKIEKEKKLQAQFSAFILGIGGSGKTTFVKQMRIVYNIGFPEAIRMQFKDILLHNTIVGLEETVVKAEKMEMVIGGDVLRYARMVKQIAAEAGDCIWNHELVEKLLLLWQDPTIQATFKIMSAPDQESQGSPELTFLEYHMNNLKNYISPTYLPVNEDLLRARQRTSGSNSNEITIEKKFHWTFIDMGGQVQERTKWNEIIQEQGAKLLVKKPRDHYKVALFFIAIDEYNMSTSEYPEMTKLEAALSVFRRTLETQVGDQLTAIVLFLNKMDVFEQKIKNKNSFLQFKKAFPKYNGEIGDELTASKFIANYCIEIYKKATENANVDKELAVHATCALDTKAMEQVFNTVRTNLLASSLTEGNSGFNF